MKSRRNVGLWSIGVVALVVSMQSLAFSGITAQNVIELKLDASYPDGFGFLNTVRELSDGRVLIADPLGQVLVEWNIETGIGDTLGRVGHGPMEYRQPDAVFPLPADSTLVVDLGNARLITVGPRGLFGSVLQIMQPLSGNFPTMVMPRFVDAAGRIYFLQTEFTPNPPVDSAFVSVFDRNRLMIDTVGTVMISVPEFEIVGNEMVMTRGPLLPNDDWAIGMDGRIAFVRAEDYSVEWVHTDGRSVRGPPTAYQAVFVRRAEQERWVDEAFANQLGMIGVHTPTGAEGGVAFARGGGERPTTDRVEWPDVLPPFRSDRSLVSAEGDLWVERFVAAMEPPVIDVFDSRGQLSGQVLLAMGCHIVGFGEGVAYTTCADADEIHWLRRYRIIR